MTIKTSGPLSFTEIHDEFKTLGGTLNQTPYQLSEYRGLPVGMGLPQSGTIKFSDFYGNLVLGLSQAMNGFLYLILKSTPNIISEIVTCGMR